MDEIHHKGNHVDALEPWQIAIAIRLQNAVRYLRLLRLDAQRARRYSTIYKCEDVKEWARNHARNQIELINQSTIEHHLHHTDVQSVAAGWSNELHALGLNITVSAVGGIKTDGGNDGQERTTQSSHGSAPPLARRGTAQYHAATGTARLLL